MNNIRSHGSIPMFTWRHQNGSQGVTQSFTLANIINGAYDIYITNWAASAKAGEHPFFLRLAHEMNGTGIRGAQVSTAIRPPNMCRCGGMVTIFLPASACVTWVWCVNVIPGMPTPISQLYPGDNYVDWLALDGYNRLANPYEIFRPLRPRR